MVTVGDPVFFRLEIIGRFFAGKYPNFLECMEIDWKLVVDSDIQNIHLFKRGQMKPSCNCHLPKMADS